jgi:hypothetical protein
MAAAFEPGDCEFDRALGRERLQVRKGPNRGIGAGAHEIALGFAHAADPGEAGKIIGVVSLHGLLDEHAGHVENPDRVAVGLRAVELGDAARTAAGGDVERHDADVGRKIALHDRRDEPDIGVEAPTRSVGDDELDVFCRKSRQSCAGHARAKHE